MKQFKHLILLTPFIGSLLVSAVQAGNWPEFRGPNGDGKAPRAELPVKFGESRNVTWKSAIHGRGWSSPVIWNDQIWMTTATEDGYEMFAVCVDRETGRIVHDRKVFDVADPKFRHPTNSYASPTPAIEQDRIYVHFGQYGTACLDTKTGKTLWTRRDFVCDDYRGPGSSPILYENLLIVHFDGIDVQYVVALDKATGDTVWRKTRTIDFGNLIGDRRKGYCTPRVFDVDGRKELISPTAVGTIAYDPFTGEELWRVRHGGMNAAARPLYANGLVYISAGANGSQLIAVRPGGSGNVTDSRIVWKQSKGVPHRSSQLVVGDLFFMVSDSGVASCLNAKTGKLIWQKRLGGMFWASPLYADGKIYFFSQDGKIPVVAASRKFELLAENQLEAGFNASPAVADNALFLRTETHLYRIEK